MTKQISVWMGRAIAAIACGGLGGVGLISQVASAKAHAAAKSHIALRVINLSSGFEHGTVGGWSVDYGPARLSNTTAVEFAGTDALVANLTGKGNPAVMSPTLPSGVGGGSRYSLHVYEHRTDRYRVEPYVMDGAWKAHFGPAETLSPGRWKALSYTAPAGVNHVRYFGLQVENGEGAKGAIAIDSVKVKVRVRSKAITSPSLTTVATAATTTMPAATPTAATTASSTTAVPLGDPGIWTLKFDDEFNGTSLDRSLWSPNWFNEGGSMNNVGTYAANVSVANGVVSLKLSSATSGALISTNPTGGATKGFQFTYGFAEARVNFPGSGSTVDNWPAFWTDGQNWPTNGEIDIAEGLGTLTSNYHNPAGAFNSNTIAGTWTGGWHTYGVDWEPGSITIYWDGQVVHRLTSATTPITSSPQYLIFNVGAGEGPTAAGATMQIDDVRVWQH